MNQVHQNRNDHVVEDTCDEIDFLHPYEYANETDEMDDYERGYDDEAVPADFTDITEIVLLLMFRLLFFSLMEHK